MTVNLTESALKRIAPDARSDIISALISASSDFDKAGITTTLRMAHFLSQICVETGGLTKLEENLNYSAARLMKVWPTRFKTLASAQKYAGQPEKLANYVYGGRLGNKNPGDGWKYRGGSMIQTTGFTNYDKAGHASDPDTLRKPRPALLAALKYWVDNGCNDIADHDDPAALRKRIQGGNQGLSDAKLYLSRAKSALKSAAVTPGGAAIPVLTKKQVNSVMHLGSKGDFVKTLQANLNSLGYPHIEEDGIFGRDTDTNVRAFQTDASLEKVDGWAGPATVAAIAAELAKRETAPKIEAASQVVDANAGSVNLGGFSKTEAVAAIAGTTGTANAVKEGIDSVKDTTSSAMDLIASVGPWVLLAIVLAGGAAFIIYDRRKKRLLAQAAQKVI